MQVVDKYGNTFGQGHLIITSKSGKSKLPVVTVEWGNITGILKRQSDLQKALDYKVPIDRTITINGNTQDLSEDRTWTISTGITVNTTPITGGVSGRLLFDDAGVVGETNGVHWDKVNSRLGIGTSIPLFPLDVLGTAKFASATSGIIIRDWTTFNTYRAVYKASETPSDTNYLLALDQDVLINSRGSGTDIRFNGAIRARFGNAFSLRVIGSGTTTATVGFEAANSSSTPLFQVRDNGNVLIGTTTDAGYKLDVNGASIYRESLTNTTGGFLHKSTSPSNDAFWSIVSGSVYFYVSAGGYCKTTSNLVTAATGVGTINASAISQIDSVTKGFLPPRMTNAQMLAIATPAEGLMVYDTTNRKLCCYDGATWQNLF